jgi:hypothetical protein
MRVSARLAARIGRESAMWSGVIKDEGTRGDGKLRMLS